MKQRKGQWRQNYLNFGNCAYILRRHRQDVRVTMVITAQERPRQSRRAVRAAVTPAQFTGRWSDARHLPTESGRIAAWVEGTFRLVAVGGWQATWAKDRLRPRTVHLRGPEASPVRPLEDERSSWSREQTRRSNRWCSRS